MHVGIEPGNETTTLLHAHVHIHVFMWYPAGTFWNNAYIQTDPPNLIGNVACTGSESRLVDCPHTTGESDRAYVIVNCPIRELLYMYIH